MAGTAIGLSPQYCIASRLELLDLPIPEGLTFPSHREGRQNMAMCDDQHVTLGIVGRRFGFVGCVESLPDIVDQSI